ncbi:hypothetical protein K0T92_07345 [Paenibacillus oenotherae]|uniref:Uncharacterized protein n=1 Tax=Paenibacillus oenotherae TaxID=1435645 RepID=A0ABS7D3W3_9BACL|nr:hypothetical protein [Paenibacillus oenotherae]MBW7474556.1 hypothetical protein [Paenibacillus oenotherae]
MEIVKIVYPTPLSDIEDIYNANIDVLVTLEDGITYTIVVTTPLNLLWYMDKENLSYMPTPPPEIIVKCLTESTIEEAIKNYAADDAFWLKILFISGVDKNYIDLKSIEDALKNIQKENEELLS